MASQENAGSNSSAPPSFGAWLRHLREAKGFAQRSVAAAADMDSSHYAKVEGGKRPFTATQLVAVARFLGQPEVEMRRRWLAAQMLDLCAGDHALAAATAGLVREAAAPYLVNKSANKVRARK